MPTLASRINITLPYEVAERLHDKSARQKISMSRTALELIMDAMERDEDLFFSKIAEEREHQNKRWFSHADAWK